LFSREAAVAGNTKYIPTLTGWRAVSVVAVVLYHGRIGFFGDDSLLTSISARGYMGVDVFFAISGFLICSLLLRESGRTGAIDLRRFYMRRCLRILPPYYVALAVLALLGVMGVIRIRLLNVPSCLFFYRNLMPLGMDAHGDFYTAHFWSLAVEEQFYLLWPVLLLGLQAARVALCLALLSLFWKVLAGQFPLVSGIMPAPMSLLSHTDTILWGCLAAIYLPQLREWAGRVRCSQLWLPLLALLLGTQASHSPLLLPLSAVLLPALVLSTVLQPGSWLGRVLEWPPLCWLGTLSYSIYLWQELFLPELPSETARRGLHLLQHAPWNVWAILVCACASHYLVEMPASWLAQRLSALPRQPGMQSGPFAVTQAPEIAADMVQRTGS
jgi:peptidoglycan/LPS O-acetylase OafA/YrhL